MTERERFKETIDLWHEVVIKSAMPQPLVEDAIKILKAAKKRSHKLGSTVRMKLVVDWEIGSLESGQLKEDSKHLEIII